MDEERLDSEPSIAAWKASTSSGGYSRGFHARGFWLKIWMAWQPRSTPRSTALATPPAGETWAPINIRTPHSACKSGLTADTCSCQLNHASTTCR